MRNSELLQYHIHTSQAKPYSPKKEAKFYEICRLNFLHLFFKLIISLCVSSKLFQGQHKSQFFNVFCFFSKKRTFVGKWRKCNIIYKTRAVGTVGLGGIQLTLSQLEGGGQIMPSTLLLAPFSDFHTALKTLGFQSIWILSFV